MNILSESDKQNCPQEWIDIYSYVIENNIQKVIELFNNYNQNSHTIESYIYYLHPITAFASQTNNTELLNWLFSIPNFEIDSFQLFLIATEYNNVDVVEWGIRRYFEFLPHHILNTVINGSVDILDYLYNNLNEDDVNILFSEVFIKHAISEKQTNVIDWYRSCDIEINDDETGEDEEEII